ncbi:MAG: VWA domain-containing protein [Candidatus Obscuribacterales bacterium]|nr:VWA domain-containing protein [Candidatus Obscuribacterales bacterium]
MSLPIQFVSPLMLLLACLAVPIIWYRSKRQPAVLHSKVSVQKSLGTLPLLGWLPNVFFALTAVCIAAALAKPVLPEQVEKEAFDTRDIMIAVDISGSMTSALPGGAPPGATAIAKGKDGKEIAYRALDAAEDATKTFTASRQGDRVGIFVFDDQTYYYWPMSRDLKIIQRKADLINSREGGGTNFEGPTEHDPRYGPIQAAIEHWKEYGQAKTKILILVSDGQAPISEKRFQELTTQMKEVNGRIYMLGIGGGWLSEATGNGTDDIRKLVAELKGKCFAAADAKQMQEAMATIDSLEKSTVYIEKTTNYRPIYSYFVAASIIFLVLFLGSTLLTRERA